MTVVTREQVEDWLESIRDMDDFPPQGTPERTAAEAWAAIGFIDGVNAGEVLNPRALDLLIGLSTRKSAASP